MDASTLHKKKEKDELEKKLDCDQKIRHRINEIRLNGKLKEKPISICRYTIYNRRKDR